jgi:GPH family glycoside/pentoside/hexuronide:cation symporter
MLADVCDFDELKTGLRREGMYGAVYAWVYKAGSGLSMTLGGLLIQWIGVNPELGGAQTQESILWMRILYPVIPAACIAFALLLVYLCPLTESRTREVRTMLDARHSKSASEEISVLEVGT